MHDPTSLAWERTWLALERTLMAWLRTAASMITFGFAIYKSFDFLREAEPAALQRAHLLGAPAFGVFMMALGVSTLLAATAQHHLTRKRLGASFGVPPFSIGGALAALLAVLGILGVATALFAE